MAGTEVLSEESAEESSTNNTPTFVNIHSTPTEKRDPRLLWKQAFRCLLKSNQDPWNDFPLHTIFSRTALRHRYSALKKKWVQDTIHIKMESVSFDQGAMRECFRLKKQSAHSSDWSSASSYVAKRYLSPVKRHVYFDDVLLQMETKLWAEAYNKQNPPKKVDIFQMSVLEFPGETEDSSQLYHIERFMEGDYRKYNSNSGFVDDANECRNTPQAFSHFTFERSGHKRLIVDIQGVGDLYTDPQMHTDCGQGYGDGNLGPRGMALFFHSHKCNAICQWLGIEPFDLAPSETEAARDAMRQRTDSGCGESGTSVRDDRPPPNPMTSSPVGSYLRSPVNMKKLRDRAMSSDSGILDLDEALLDSDNMLADFWLSSTHQSMDDVTMEGNQSLSSSSSSYQWRSLRRQRTSSSCCSGGVEMMCGSRVSFDLSTLIGDDTVRSGTVSSSGSGGYSWPLTNRRIRTVSESSELDTQDDDRHSFHAMLDHQKSTSAHHPSNLDQEIGHSVLGQIHHELALLHHSGRFNSGDHLDESKDWSAILFHEGVAAQLGCLPALVSMGRYALQLAGGEQNLLQDCPVEPSPQAKSLGLDYLIRAAECDDVTSMLDLALYLDNNASSCDNKGDGGGDGGWSEAVMWYQRAVDQWPSCEDSLVMTRYAVLARLAEIYAEGGWGVAQNYSKASCLYMEAGEAATAALKGRTASKYFQLGEELASLTTSSSDEDNPAD